MIGQTVRWLVCSILFVVCAHGESDSDRNKAAEPMNDLMVTRNLAYEPGDRHGLDVYVLRAPATARPVVVYLYGGNWTAGSKADFAWVGAALARRGFVAVIPDYRLYPAAHWPMFLEDNAAALRWARDHAVDFGGDPSRLVLMGHSAGANNGLYLTVDPRWLNRVGMKPRDLKAFIGLSGPYNLSPLDTAQELAIFGSSTGYVDPIHHVDGHSPPMLLLIGDQDEAADPRDSDAVAARVRQNGGVAETIRYAGLHHSDTQSALAAAPGGAPHVLDAILHFLTAQGAAPATMPRPFPAPHESRGVIDGPTAR